MKICRKIYEALLSDIKQINCNREVGGILGGKGTIIDTYELDSGIDTYRACVYKPNVKKLNRMIQEWHEKNIEFMGIFHTHFGNAEHLSNGDKEYILKIMKNMPQGKDQLYFPIIVYPSGKMVVYIAIYDESGNINLTRDDLHIV